MRNLQHKSIQILSVAVMFGFIPRVDTLDGLLFRWRTSRSRGMCRLHDRKQEMVPSYCENRDLTSQCFIQPRKSRFQLRGRVLLDEDDGIGKSCTHVLINFDTLEIEWDDQDPASGIVGQNCRKLSPIRLLLAHIVEIIHNLTVILGCIWKDVICSLTSYVDRNFPLGVYWYIM